MDNLYTHQIMPGILEKNWQDIEKKIEIIKTFSNKIHIDIIDGKFVQNTTFTDPIPFSKYSKEIYFEAHLMVEEPINYLDSFAKAGFKKFVGHIEKMSSQKDFVAKAELLGEVGLALDLETPIEEIKVPFEDLDLILLMSVHAGASSQSFEQSSLQKIKDLRSKTEIPIEIDGGINDQTLVLCKDAGANIFVSTSFITGSTNPHEQYSKLQSLL